MKFFLSLEFIFNNKECYSKIEIHFINCLLKYFSRETNSYYKTFIPRIKNNIYNIYNKNYSLFWVILPIIQNFLSELGIQVENQFYYFNKKNSNFQIKTNLEIFFRLEY